MDIIKTTSRHENSIQFDEFCAYFERENSNEVISSSRGVFNQQTSVVNSTGN